MDQYVIPKDSCENEDVLAEAMLDNGVWRKQKYILWVQYFQPRLLAIRCKFRSTIPEGLSLSDDFQSVRARIIIEGQNFPEFRARMVKSEVIETWQPTQSESGVYLFVTDICKLHLKSLRRRTEHRASDEYVEIARYLLGTQKWLTLALPNNSFIFH